jgi:branched-chain amino acid transport system permease protein
MLILQILLNGVLLGGVYACMAVGFSIAWGVTGIINLAYGAMAMAGAYIAWFAAGHSGIDPLLLAPVSALCLFGAGYGLQRSVLNRVVASSLFMTLILSFGLNMVLVNVLLGLFSADFRSIPFEYARGTLVLAGLRLPRVRVVVFVAAVGCVAALGLLLTRTRSGQAIMATAQNPQAALVLGLDPRHTYALAFGISTGLAGVAGTLMGILYPFAPMSGESITMKAFVIVILGGLGSIRGALAGGIFLGIVENAASAVAPGFRDAAGFLVLLAVLLLRPAGLLGKAAAVEGPQFPAALPGPRIATVKVVTAVGISAAVLSILPLWLNPYWLRVVSTVFKYAALAQGLNIIAGYTGYAAFGNVVFFGLGAYGTAAIVLLLPGIPIWAAMLAGCLVCPLAALLVGPSLLRLRGHTFAIATLGLNLAVRELVSNVDSLGGGSGLSMPLTPWTPLQSAKIFYFVFLALMAGATGLVWLFARSRLGLVCRAIRDDEAKAVAMGLPTKGAKLSAWTISATITGLVGSIDAWWITFIDPTSSFDMGLAVESFVILLLGGAGTLFGPLVGAAFVEITGTLTWSHLLKWHLGVMGLLVMLAVLLVPTGWADALRRLRTRRPVRLAEP